MALELGGQAEVPLQEMGGEAWDRRQGRAGSGD